MRLISTCLFILALLPASAMAQEGAAGRYLKGQHDRVNRILARPANAQRNTQIKRVIGGLLDYQAVSEGALASHWEEHSEEEQAEFVDLLRQLVERSYERSLTSTAAYQIAWGDEVRRGGTVRVHTTARSRSNRRAPEVVIEYHMRRQGNRWVVVDVVTDGVSMVRNYRRQFDRIIRRDGWDGLLSRMRNRLEGRSI